MLVPAPTINISGLTNKLLYTGTNLFLTCTLELNSAVDSEFRVAGVWRRGGEMINSSRRVNISETALIRPSVYQTTISIRPISDTMDSGSYSCHSSIPSDQFVLFTDGSQQVTVNIEGMTNYKLIILYLW